MWNTADPLISQSLPKLSAYKASYFRVPEQWMNTYRPVIERKVQNLISKPQFYSEDDRYQSFPVVLWYGAMSVDTGEIDIWDNSLPVEEILPIPIGWLDRRLKENGSLRNTEYKISY